MLLRHPQSFREFQGLVSYWTCWRFALRSCPSQVHRDRPGVAAALPPDDAEAWH